MTSSSVVPKHFSYLFIEFLPYFLPYCMWCFWTCGVLSTNTFLGIHKQCPYYYVLYEYIVEFTFEITDYCIRSFISHENLYRQFIGKASSRYDLGIYSDFFHHLLVSHWASFLAPDRYKDLFSHVLLEIFMWSFKDAYLNLQLELNVVTIEINGA